MKVENLNGYANQFIIYDWHPRYEIKTFQSYKSKIATLKKWLKFNEDTLNHEHIKTTLEVFSDWDYSKTTMRHFKRFINEETPFTYEDSKQWRLEMKNNPQIEEVL